MREVPGVSLHWPGNYTKAELLAEPGQKLIDSFRYFHKVVRGWRDIGYHYVIHRDAQGEWRDYDGRLDIYHGAHSGTTYGNKFIGINLAYGTDETPEPEALEVLAQLISDLSKKYGFEINRDTVKSHRDFVPTECSGDPLYNMIDDIIELSRSKKSNKVPEPITNDVINQEPEDQVFPITAILDGKKIPALLVNSQTYIYAGHIGKASWDGEQRQTTISTKGARLLQWMKDHGFDDILEDFERA